MGIKFYKKNIYDLSNSSPATTITDGVATDTGEESVDLMRNRDNNSGWSTTDSSDAGNTEIQIDFIDVREFDSILLLGHNLKSFDLMYWDGALWQDFSTPIDEATNTATSNYYTFTTVFSSLIRLRMYGTQTADDDKQIRQFIVTELVGEFTSFEPKIEPAIDKDRQNTKFISGKYFVTKSKGGFQCLVEMESVANDSDLTLVETIFDSYEGVLLSLSGGTNTQFETQRQGYRLEDVFLVQCSNEYEPEYNGGFYNHGMKVRLKLVEVN